MKLHDFPDEKMLKVNRRNNSLHYQVYQKNKNVRFELELNPDLKKISANPEIQLTELGIFKVK